MSHSTCLSKPPNVIENVEVLAVKTYYARSIRAGQCQCVWVVLKAKKVGKNKKEEKICSGAAKIKNMECKHASKLRATK